MDWAKSTAICTLFVTSIILAIMILIYVYLIRKQSHNFIKELEINLKELEVDKKNRLGRGEFGTVYFGTYRNIKVAVKILHGNDIQKIRTQFLDEVKMLKMVKGHQNVVNILGASTKINSMLILLEYCHFGSLEKCLKDHRTKPDRPKFQIDRRLQKFWVLQIALGMKWLALENIVHGDLACRNILVESPERVKIADFGMAKHLYTYEYRRIEENNKMPWLWMAPEAFDNLKVTHESDVYSFGISVWEIYRFAQLPLPHILYTVQGIPNDMWEIIGNCLEREPEKRPTFEKIVQELANDTETHVRPETSNPSNIRRTYITMAQIH